jgi:hypothetical protein
LFVGGGKKNLKKSEKWGGWEATINNKRTLPLRFKRISSKTTQNSRFFYLFIFK